MNSMEEKTKTDSSVYFVKLNDTDMDNRDTIEILTHTIDKKEIAKDKEGRRDTQENYATVHRNNSVSKMTQHFKTLQEKISPSTATENECQHKTLQKSSRGVQRYRERKIQGGERFNTQPVTSQEVREAVLQNQRNTALVSGLVDEPEPSKLSLAERVRFFNQKIAATDAVPRQERFTQKKRLAARYKTQPVTSEEVEVASRISPLNVDHQIQTLVGGKY